MNCIAAQLGTSTEVFLRTGSASRMETFGEYDPATPVVQNYCSRISAQEYEAQGSMETYAALQNLLEYMDSNSEVFRKILAKKKQEEAENEGIFSFLKCKLLEKVKGPNFMMADITENESSEKLQQMQKEMCDVFNYVQDTKSSPVAKRFSKRLAAKRSNRSTPGKTAAPKRTKGPAPPPPPPPPPYPPPGSCRPQDDPEGLSLSAGGSILGITPSPRKPLRYESSSSSGRKMPQKPSREAENMACPPSVPPPPPPPLPSTTPKSAVKKPLQEKTNTAYITTPTGPCPSPAKKALLKSEQRMMQLKKAGSTTSLNSISSIHDELMGFDKGKLKSVKNRSPGRTSKKKAPPKPSRTGRMGDITIDSFNLKILEKFKNAHSPSRYGSPYSEGSSLSSSGLASPSGFTP